MKTLLRVLSYVLVGALCAFATWGILSIIESQKTKEPTVKLCHLSKLKDFYEGNYSPTNYAQEDMNIGKVLDEETAIAEAKKLFEDYLRYTSSKLDQYEYKAYFDIEKACWYVKGEFPKSFNSVTLGITPRAVIAVDGQVLGLWKD